MSTHPYLGVNVNAASVEEMLYRGLLDEGEMMLALFDGTLLDENRRRVGGVALSDFVALTDRRLITWARGFFNDTVDGFVWQDVDVAHAETWDPWHGRVSLAFRLPPVAPRQRRILVRGVADDGGTPERVIVNTLDYMPADDVMPLAKMVAWVGDQVLAGLAGAELAAAFAAEFPSPEPKEMPPFFGQVEPTPPPAPEPPAPEPKRRWWQRKAEEPELAAPATPGNLIAAYESQRGGLPAGAGGAAVPRPAAGPLPTLPEQPSMYEVSRSLRLFLEAPRRLARGLRRANEMVSGAGELVSGMQDPRVRRNAMRGIYQAAAQQEAEGGLLASVAPVVRAAVRFSEPLEEEPTEAPSRRIQVRATTRSEAPARRPPTRTPVEPQLSLQPDLPAAAREAPPAPRPIRRSISVRHVAPEADAPPETPDADRAAALPPEHAPEPAPRTPVRRLVVSRGDAPAYQPAPATRNGNGHHPEDE